MSQCLFSFGKEGSVWYCIKERGHEGDHAFNDRPDWTPETPQPEQTAGEHLLACLAMQLHAGIADRDRWWAEYRRRRSRVVVVPDRPKELRPHDSTSYLEQHGPGWKQAVDGWDVERRNEVVKTLKGAAAQPNIAAARPMILSAIEKLGQ